MRGKNSRLRNALDEHSLTQTEDNSLYFPTLSNVLNRFPSVISVFSPGESVPEIEQMTNAKDNRHSQVFESLALLAPTQPAVSDKERKKFEDEKSKLYTQLDEKVRINYDA